jgi:hypothetical protein
LHQDIDVLRFNRATIQYSYTRGNVFLKQIANNASEKSVNLLGLSFGGGFPGTDGPYRLIGNNELQGIIEVDPGQAGPQLLFEDGQGLSSLALFQGLADAEDRRDAMLQGSEHALVDHCIAFLEYLPPFGMADNGHGGADILQHGRRNLAGIGALLLPVHILGRQQDVRSSNDIGNRGQSGGGRRHHDITITHAGGGRHNGTGQLSGFIDCGMHLPVTGDQRPSYHKYMTSCKKRSETIIFPAPLRRAALCLP